MAVWLRLRALEVDEQLARSSSTQTTSDASDLTVAGHTSSPNSDAEPYEIAPVDSTSSPEQRAAISSREQRYQELLRSAPPAAAKVEKPSLFDRIVNPVANALGINRQQQPRPAQPAQTAANVATRSQPSASTPRASDSGRTSTANDDPREAPPEEDPETDVIPPQLLGAEFNPTQIADGEETTFAVLVNDNLSGVRSVSGVIASPSGSLQGFSCLREGETNRFVARVAVPKDAPSGTWAVRYLTLSDNASNSVNLNQAQGSLPGTASFKVVSAGSDSTGPQLKNIWLDKQAMRAGDRNTIFVQAEDEKSGVSLVSGVFVSPSKTARIGFGCRSGAGGTWECPITPPACLDCGIWTLEQVQLQDKANNMTTFRGDNPLVQKAVLDISGDHCDSQPPQVTMVTLSPTVVTNAQASVITVTATMIDEGGCGASSLSAQAIPPGGVGGQRRPVTFMPSQDGQTFIGRLEIPQFAAKGQWSIAWIQALDKGLNLRAYSSNDPVVSRATFTVE